jgi:hypothetical protein
MDAPSLLLLAVNRIDALSSLEASSSTLVVVEQHVVGSVIFLGSPVAVSSNPAETSLSLHALCLM